MNKYLFIILSFFFFFSVAHAQKEKLRIAVLELEANGVGKSESATLSNRLRSELVRTGSFIMLERAQMDDILEEQGFQLSGCTSDECAVKIGKLLNVNQILAGNIGKIGSIYTVSVRLINVESGEIVKSVNEDCKCSLELVLTSSMRNIALKLAGRMQSNTEPNILSEGTGDLYLKSTPSSAQIFLDNINTSKTTPSTLKNVVTGKHIIKVVKGDFVGITTVTVKTNDIINRTITLEKAKGDIRIYSNPQEAEIYINDEYFGNTPKVVKQLAVGNYNIALKSYGYSEKHTTAKVIANQVFEINAVLDKVIPIKITSSPENAFVFMVLLEFV